MSTSSSSTLTSTSEEKEVIPQLLQGLQNRQQLENLLDNFFSENNISLLMKEISSVFRIRYSLQEGPSVDVLSKETEPTKFKVSYRPGLSHNTPCPNHFVDKALEIALRKAGYEVEVGKHNNESPHTRSMIVTINRYILDAILDVIKCREENRVLSENLKTYTTENHKLKNVLQGRQKANNDLTMSLAQLQKNSALNQDLKNQLEKNLTHQKTYLQQSNKNLKTNLAELQKVKTQNNQLKKTLESKQLEKRDLEKSLQTTRKQNITLNDKLTNVLLQKSIITMPLQLKNKELTETNKELKENFLNTVRELNKEVKSAIEASKTETTPKAH